jgi:hypothetical protein
MKIFEVDSSMGMAPPPNPAQLSGLVQFLNGRANDTNAKKRNQPGCVYQTGQ